MTMQKAIAHSVVKQDQRASAEPSQTQQRTGAKLALVSCAHAAGVRSREGALL